MPGLLLQTVVSIKPDADLMNLLEWCGNHGSWCRFYCQWLLSLVMRWQSMNNKVENELRRMHIKSYCLKLLQTARMLWTFACKHPQTWLWYQHQKMVGQSITLETGQESMAHDMQVYSSLWQQININHSCPTHCWCKTSFNWSAWLTKKSGNTFTQSEVRDVALHNHIRDILLSMHFLRSQPYLQMSWVHGK